MKRIHNSETNEIIDIESDENDLAEINALQAAKEQREAEIKIKNAARAAVYEKLGLTTDDLKALGL
jgi:hypothetical protein